MVCRRENQSLAQLSRSARHGLAKEQSRRDLGRRIRRNPHPDLSAAALRSFEVRERAEIAWASGRAIAWPFIWGCRRNSPLRCWPAHGLGRLIPSMFGGFSSQALIDRINDAQCCCVITQDGTYRRGAEIRLKATVDDAVGQCPSVKNVLVYRRTGTQQHMSPGRDHWWHELMPIASDECAGRAARFRTPALPSLHLRHDG